MNKLSVAIVRQRDRLVRATILAKLRLMVWAYAAVRRASRWFHIAGYGANTAVGVLLFLWTTIGVQLQFNERRFILPLYIGAATLIGTMVVLAVNLSLIPVQRAAERYASSVLRIFSEDLLTRALIVVLASLSLLLFAVGIHGFLAGPSLGWTGVPILVVAVALDLMRWHHRRTTRLLDASVAISRLGVQATKAIDRVQQRIARLAQLNWRLLPDQVRASHSPEALEARLYVSERSHREFLVTWSNGLGEIALKALDRGDDLAAREAASVLALVAAHYLGRRKDNLVLEPADLGGVLRSEGYDVLEPTLATLKQLVGRAASRKNEGVATAAIRSLGGLTGAVAALDGKPFKEKAGALAWLPLGYLTESIKTAQREGLGDSALEGSRVLLRLVAALPAEVGITEAHLSITYAWRDIAAEFLAAGQGEIARDPIGNIIRMNWVLLERAHWQRDHCLGESLRALEALAPIVFRQEKEQQAFGLLRLPLSTAYDLADQRSLPYLVQKAATQIKRDPERPWVSPYADFIRLNEVIYRHLRELAEMSGAGTSALMWHIGRMVGHVAEVYRELLATPVTDNQAHLAELAGGVSWYIACLWAAFDKTPPSSVRWAGPVVDETVEIGMHYCDGSFKEIVTNCGGAIKSIARSCYKGGARSPYDIADLLMGIWKLRLLAGAKGEVEIVGTLDPMLARLPEIPEDQWKNVEEALALRKQQLEEEIEELRGGRIDAFTLAMRQPELLIARARRDALRREATDKPQVTQQEAKDGGDEK